MAFWKRGGTLGGIWVCEKERIFPGVLVNGQQISGWQISTEECAEVLVIVA